MTGQSQGTGIGEEGSRKRRAHRKSRQGCRNCKLRRVKCDETRPRCKECATFAVSCNYDPKVPDLQISFDGTASIKALQKQPYSINQALLGMIDAPASLYPTIIVSDNNSTFQLDRQCLDRVRRFQIRTALSIGTAKVVPDQKHPYLMHVVQTITAIHDRYLSASPNSRYSITEIYHWSQAAALFHQKLSSPVKPSDRDALLATASLICIIAFSWVEASNPEEAWPLKRAEPSDLEWLRMIDGKAAVWKIANPLRPDSIFHDLAADYEIDYPFSALTRRGIEGIPCAFVLLYSVDNSSTVHSNPYHAAVHTIAPLLHIECDPSTVVRFLSFITLMQPAFKRLLEQKDPRALLLLAYWYAKVCHSLWWMVRRAVLECQAICIYLERHHAGERAIQEMLQFPKMRCGLA
ncbi:hypothetical protein V1505DRAFT_95659 [Lipomyces doorenjongii]